jgi:hypothetical protein
LERQPRVDRGACGCGIIIGWGCAIMGAGCTIKGCCWITIGTDSIGNLQRKWSEGRQQMLKWALTLIFNHDL